MKKLIIIGASGHGKVVADIAGLCGYREIVFLDDNRSISSCANYPVVGEIDDADFFEGDLFVAIGDSAIRKSIMERFSDRLFPKLLHPSAVVARTATVGPGTVVMAGAVVNPDTVIGRGVIINTCASVDHDCNVRDYSHIAVGAHLCGSVVVGEGTWVGAGATISNCLSICPGCTIGAGAVVVKDLFNRGTYIGVPAKLQWSD